MMSTLKVTLLQTAYIIQRWQGSHPDTCRAALLITRASGAVVRVPETKVFVLLPTPPAYNSENDTTWTTPSLLIGVRLEDLFIINRPLLIIKSERTVE